MDWNNDGLMCGGWVCARCGRWVRENEVHICYTTGQAIHEPNIIYLNYGQPILKKIEELLEKIVALLEKEMK